MAFPGFRQLQGFAPILCRQDFKLDAGAFTDQADQIRCNPDVFALSGKLLIRIPVGIDPGKNRTELFKAGALFRRQPDALPRRQRPRRSGTGVIVAAGFMNCPFRRNIGLVDSSISARIRYGAPRSTLSQPLARWYATIGAR